ncbi:MAG: FAD-dependent oxidoreductase, partial [Chloroflexota bacterium]|nr:FAD-dependent oxidoreductase [Chloroflexota bacterium]
MKLQKLFEPIRIGSLTSRNRIKMPGVATAYPDKGLVTDRMVDFYAARARGGVGLIAINTSPFHRAGLSLRTPCIADDSYLPGLSRLARAVKEHGASVVAQVSLAEEWAPGQEEPELVGPSDVVVSRRPGAHKPRPLTVEEIAFTAERFGEVARRARAAGFDGVEVHAAVGRLISQFMSPHTNQRTDQYGGSLENRMRFFLDIIDGILGQVGRDYALMVRISGEDFMPEGHTLEDAKLVAGMLERAGVHSIDVTTGWHEAPVPSAQMSVPRGYWAYLAAGIKQAVKIPVVGGTRVSDPIMAERLLQEGKADLIYMARPLIADPELPNKAREGRFEDIRTCIACCHCLDEIFSNRPLVCSVNAQAGREAQYAIKPTPKAKTVVIVGSGPAGLEAARVAALRGHKVTIMEQGEKLGGNLLVAAIPPYKQEIASLTTYLTGQVKKLGIPVKLRTPATAAAVLAQKPQAIVVATGSSPLIPGIPGVGGKNVVTAVDVITGKAKTGQRVVIVGGGMVGC